MVSAGFRYSLQALSAFMSMKVLMVYAPGGTVRITKLPVVSAITTIDRSPGSSGVNFTVEATGSEPLSYQWQKDGEDVPGATLPALSILGVQESDAGSYTAVVGNSAGVAVSQAAVLTVTVPDVGCAAGRVSWPADGGGRGARPLADIAVACAMAAVLVFRGKRDRARRRFF